MQNVGKEEILNLIKIAEQIEKNEIKPDIKDKIIGLLFFEPSTRTHFSFETAIKKLNGKTFSMKGTEGTSVKKGESLHDTLKTISMYVDLIVMRSPIEGAAKYASECVDIPIVNAGDGANQHPTQALLDLYSIMKTQNTLENLSVGIVGDLRFGRTVHSLVQALSDFSPTFYFHSPKHLKIPEHLKKELVEKNIKFEEIDDIKKQIPELDILYATRIQKERFSDLEEYEKVKNSYVINKDTIENAKDTFKVLHPLPRVNEIATDVDKTPYAYYFQQAKNGVYMREAIISTLLKKI